MSDEFEPPEGLLAAVSDLRDEDIEDLGFDAAIIARDDSSELSESPQHKRRKKGETDDANPCKNCQTRPTDTARAARERAGQAQ